MTQLIHFLTHGSKTTKTNNKTFIIKLKEKMFTDNNLQVAPIEQRVSEAVVAFDSKKSELTELATKHKGLKVEDINDNKALKVVSEARKELKKERCVIENQGKQIRGVIKELTDSVSKKEKELVGIISPIEDELEAEEKRVEVERERIKAEETRKREEMIQGRVKQLINLGCAFDGSRYSIGERSATHIALIQMSDSAFEEIVSVYKLEAMEIEAKRKEEERIKSEAEEAERQRVIAEQKKLEEERAELERLRAENERIRAQQEEQPRKLREEADRVEAEKRAIELEKVSKERERVKALISVRSADLKALGLVEYSGYFKHPLYEGTGIDDVALETSTPAAWADVLFILLGKVEAGKKEAEAKRFEEIEEAKEQARKEEAARIEAENKRISEEKEAAEAESKRQAALAPDKEKLVTFADSLSKLEVPTVESEAAKKIADGIKELIAKTQTYIHSKVKSL